MCMKLFKFNFIIISLLALSTFSCATAPESYQNPVIRGDLADPSIIRINDTYYACGTSSEWAPFYPMFYSKDLVNWTQSGHVFNQKPEWTSSSFWAPELYYHNGKVFCYYSARRASDGISCIGVATADSPTDEFTDHGVLVDFGREAIDAFVFNDDGQLYITWKAYGLDFRNIELVGSKLSADGLKLEGEVFSLLTDERGIGQEGQYHFKQGDYYYIFYSSRGCCGPGSDYEVSVARAKTYLGPYEKYENNPILKGGEGDFQSCGHGTGVTTPDGRMFYMCHAYMKNENFFRGRQPIVQEFKIDENGWPYFTTGNLAKFEQALPFPNIKQTINLDFTDNFRDNKLKKEWTWNYIYADMQYKIKSGKLQLSGTTKPNNHYGTALCLRPKTADYSFEAVLEGKNSSAKGLTIYGDERNLLLFTYADNKITLKSVNDGRENTLYETDYSNKKLHLKMEITDGRHCKFYWSKNGKDWNVTNDDFIDGGSVLRWDRVFRPGLIHVGENSKPAIFSQVEMKAIKN
jgi:xylan 1,4-beta-xylosidase